MGRKRKIRKELPERVYFKHNAYYFYPTGGKWTRLSKDFPTAMTKWAEIVGEQKNANKMGDIMDRYMSEVAPTMAEKTYKNNLGEIKPLKIFFGDMSPQKIKPVDIYKYLDIRSKTPTAANLEKALLSCIFSKAIKWGIVESNPCRVVKKLKVKKRNRYITDEEFQTLYALASPFIRSVLNLAYITGQRISDILNISLADLKEDGLYITQRKTGKKLIFDLTEDLKIVIAEAKSIKRNILGIYLFCSRKGTKYTYDGFNSIFYRLKVKAGLKDVHFHDIRAKATTDANAQGRDAQKLAGHESRAMTDHYIKHMTFERIEPLKKIELKK
jgi:integrase